MLLTGCYPSKDWRNKTALSSNHLGFGLSAILLSVVMLEASIGRAVYDGHLKRKRRAFDSLRRTVGFRRLGKRIEELFVLRDVIAHAHQWRVFHVRTKPKWSLVATPTMEHGYGDERFKRRVNVDKKKPTTKALGLHVVPTHIDRKDVLKVVGAVVELQQAMYCRGLLYYDLGSHRAPFRGKEVALRSICDQLLKESDPTT